MTKDEVLDLVLDWLVCYKDKSMSRNNAEDLAEELITAIKQARSAPVQEPAWYHAECDDPDYSRFTQEKDEAFAIVSDKGGYVTPLYTVPPAAPVPLTLGQKQRLWSSVGDKPTLKDRVNAYGLAIEAAHGITKGQP
jgi:hypothetical protein